MGQQMPIYKHAQQVAGIEIFMCCVTVFSGIVISCDDVVQESFMMSCLYSKGFHVYISRDLVVLYF